MSVVYYKWALTPEESVHVPVTTFINDDDERVLHADNANWLERWAASR
jgi:hypothetical protein